MGEFRINPRVLEVKGDHIFFTVGHNECTNIVIHDSGHRVYADIFEGDELAYRLYDVTRIEYFRKGKEI